MTPRLTRRLSALTLALTALALVVPAAPALARGWGSDKVQGNGRIKTEARAIGHFNGVALALPGSVELRIGATESVTIETDDNLLPLIETVVENGTLKIRAAKRNLDLESRRMKIVVQAKSVDHLALGGSGSIDADPLRGAKVMIDIGGSGTVNVKGIDSETLSVTLGGSGDLKVGGGATRKLSLSIAGSGDVDMGRLQSMDASVNIAGSGDARIAVRDQLSVTIAGSGDVNYYGDPRVSKTVIGSGGANKLAGASR
ncbi:MAG: head GIN domain-containing protein [Telluria sp.]